MSKKERIEQLEKEVDTLKKIVENLNKKINSIHVIPNPYYPQPYDTTNPPWVTPGGTGDPPYWWQNAPTCQITYRLEG